MSPKLILRVQQASAILVISISTVVAIYSMAGKRSIIYLSTFFVINLLFTFTLIIKHKSMQILQVLLFLFIGACAIWFGENTYFIGDIIMITGILLAYTYRIIKHYSYKSIPFIVLFIVFIQLSSNIILQHTINTDNIVTTALASTLIFFILTQLNTKLTLYTRESCRKDAFIRLGINTGNLLHNLNIGTAKNALYLIEKKIRENKPDEALAFTGGLKKWLDEKESIRNQLMTAINRNLSDIKKFITIEGIIEAILTIEKINSKILTKIIFRTDFCPGGTTIDAVPFEIYFLLQNIINNAMEAMRKKKQEDNHILSIQTKKNKKQAIITITDTGGGFPVPLKNKTKDIDPENIKNGKKKEAGYGLTYIVTLVKQNRGQVRFCNTSRGVKVTVIFPLKTRISMGRPVTAHYTGGLDQ